MEVGWDAFDRWFHNPMLLELQTLLSLTKKVLFLVALATAKRVGELQGFSNVVSSLGQDLCFVPTFLSS